MMMIFKFKCLFSLLSHSNLNVFQLARFLLSFGYNGAVHWVCLNIEHELRWALLGNIIIIILRAWVHNYLSWEKVFVFNFHADIYSRFLCWLKLNNWMSEKSISDGKIQLYFSPHEINSLFLRRQNVSKAKILLFFLCVFSRRTKNK